MATVITMQTIISAETSPAQKLDFIFSHICNGYNSSTGRKNNEGGVWIDLETSYMNLDFNYVGLQSYSEMVFYLDTMEEKGWLKLNRTTNGQRQYINEKIFYPKNGKLTFSGLNYLSEMEKRGALSNKCFVAMAFDEKKEHRLQAIQQACLAYGFEAFIIDNYPTKDTQTIDAKIIAAIKESRFCVIDFTSLNLGAYFEAGMAIGRDMKVIFICDKNDFHENKKHFDVNHYPFICYDGFSHLQEILTSEIGAYVA